jgi:hypothetical protein
MSRDCSLEDRIDATTIADLRERGSQNKARRADTLGAWIAEMKFGVAPETAAPSIPNQPWHTRENAGGCNVQARAGRGLEVMRGSTASV